MSSLRKGIRRFGRDERGLETVEYAVVASLIVACLVLILGVLLPSIIDKFHLSATTVKGL